MASVTDPIIYSPALAYFLGFFASFAFSALSGSFTKSAEWTRRKRQGVESHIAFENRWFWNLWWTVMTVSEAFTLWYVLSQATSPAPGTGQVVVYFIFWIIYQAVKYVWVSLFFGTAMWPGGSHVSWGLFAAVVLLVWNIAMLVIGGLVHWVAWIWGGVLCLMWFYLMFINIRSQQLHNP